MKNSYLAMPVSSTFVLVMGVGYIIGGIRSAAIVCGFLLFIAMTEWWDRALITAYMATFGVIISSIIGISIDVPYAASAIDIGYSKNKFSSDLLNRSCE